MKAGRDRWFFSGMAAAVIAIVAAGFAPTYYFRPIVAAPALPLPDAGTPFGLSSLRRAQLFELELGALRNLNAVLRSRRFLNALIGTGKAAATAFGSARDRDRPAVARLIRPTRIVGHQTPPSKIARRLLGRSRLALMPPDGCPQPNRVRRSSSRV